VRDVTSGCQTAVQPIADDSHRLWKPVEIREPGNYRSAKSTAIFFLAGSQTGPKKNKEEEEENTRFQTRHPGYNIHRGRRAWTAVKRDLEGWIVERRTDLESGGEGDVVVIDFIPLAHVNKRASQVEGRYKEETVEEGTAEGTAE
jgi:hypothetical protein